MADEQNQNDQVKDLLARLRSQMSQLDAMFDVGASQTPSSDEPAVSQENTVIEEAPLSEVSEVGEEFDVIEESEEAEEAEAVMEIEAEEEEEGDSTVVEESLPLEETVEAPAQEEPASELVQMDLFDEIDALTKEEAEPCLENEAEEDAPEESVASPHLFDDWEDDIPVFSKKNIPLHIHKERIVAEIVTEEASPAVEEQETPVVVTEVELPEEPPREKTDSHASCFVPNDASGEEELTVLSLFSPERRFDPSKYDAMLAAYEERKANSFEELTNSVQTEADKSPSIPTAPVLMPRTSGTDFSFDLVEDDTSGEMDEITAVLEAEENGDEEEEEFAEEICDLGEETLLQEEIAVEPEEAPCEVASAPEETPAPQAASATEPPRPARVFLAQGDLCDNERDSRSAIASGRIHLAPSAYRAADDRVRSEGKLPADDEEDFMDGLPSGIRDSLIGFPLGRPNRAQGVRFDDLEAPQTKKKRKTYRFPEELEGMRDEEDAAPGYVRHHLKERLHQTRARFIVVTVIAFILLLLENISLVQGFVPPGFVDVQTAGIIDALLLIGAAIAAWPRLSVGVKGMFHGRVLPESVLFVQTVIAFIYAAVWGVMGEPTLYLSFVPTLGLSILYYFRVLRCETDLRAFGKIHSAGDKLVFSPTTKREILPENVAIADDKRMYRVQKAATVKGFSARNGVVCEDEWLNLGILLFTLLVGGVCFLVAYFGRNCEIAVSLSAALFGCFLTAPIVMLGTHAFCMHRADRAAGGNSAIAGEMTVREAVEVGTVAFEDIEAAPSSGVVLSGIRVHCDDPTAVFKYLTALYGHIGGPLCGRFSGMYGDKSTPPKAQVELISATRDGISAVIDGAEIVVGNGVYMTGNAIALSYDPEDERVLSDGRSGVLYIAVNGMVCMKFYMELRISTAFEKSVMRLHALGISTILRTYDPNFNEKTVARSAALRESRTLVVGKTIEQRNDFYTERAEGGIVTSGSSGKLLRLLLLCFRAHRLLRFGYWYKFAAAVFGGLVSVVLCAIGVFAFLPSVYLALYHLVALVAYMLVVAIGVKLPEISEGK